MKIIESDPNFFTMTNGSKRLTSISLRPTHGTATPIMCPSVIPKDKRDCEVFWVSALLPRLTELQSLHPTAVSCKDDSHGMHDVIVRLDNGNSIGIQVTELTYELERARKSQRDRFITEVLECFESRDLSSHRQLLVQCSVPFIARGRYSVPRPEVLADETAAFIHESLEQKIIELDSTQVLFQWVDEGAALCVPSIAGIGIDCNLDALPRTLDMYRDAVSCLRDKKAESSSPWLLIWSQSFWRDKRWLVDILHHMKASFADSPFERVFFTESVDNSECFEANFAIHPIKA